MYCIVGSAGVTYHVLYCRFSWCDISCVVGSAGVTYHVLQVQQAQATAMIGGKPIILGNAGGLIQGQIGKQRS